MSSVDEQLEAIRREIDTIDRRLLRFINDRARANQKVAGIKAAEGSATEYYRPEREAQLRRALVEANEGPLSNREVERLFREIVSACRALQRPMCIGFLGPDGTFTEAAVYRHFGRSVQAASMESIDAVFRSVDAGACDYGVVPAENSTEGVVNHTLDMLVQSQLAICGEVELRIHHFLLSAGADPSRIERIYSHPQSFAQCRKWLDANMPAAERYPVSSNADAAKRALDEPPSAAIAGAMAADTYGLGVLARNIEDESDNTTRFLVIGTRPVGPSGVDKTSLLLSAKNRPGALYGLLRPFAERGVSMTRIESRPSRMGVWEYVFFVDIEGHVSDANVAGALAEIETHAALVKVLGSYPRASG